MSSSLNDHDGATDAIDAPDASTGIPSAGSMDTGGVEPMGRPGMHHWKQSTITDTDIAHRGGIFFAAVEMTRMPMILADAKQPDNPIVFANNAFLDLTGYEEAEILGRNCRFLQGVGTDPAHVRQLREAVAERRAIALEILNYRRDGTPFWNAVFMGPVFDPDGELIYFFASQLDVTQRRESEQQYRQAQKMEAIGQLTAGMAHDFNNLLHVVTGSLERMASKRHDDQAFARYHSAATVAAERGAKLTHQMLAFARRGRLEPKGVSLSDLVNAIAELLETSVGHRSKLRLNLQRRLPRTLLDPTHLEMALLNIVVNARDASPSGGDITVSTRDLHVDGDDVRTGRLEPGDYVELCVSDRGEGMPAHVLARATEPFFTTKGSGEGTGLGLAMAQGFVQQSGGHLDIESRPGQGTTVRMIFPVQRAGDESARPGDVEREQGQGPDLSSSAPLILVVDDSPEAAALAGDALQDIGYRVVLAHSAEEAMERFREVQGSGDGFKLVFTDVIMPGGANGLVLAERLAALDADLPILLTTGYNDEMAIDGPQPHAMDVLGKPYRRSELINRVQSALRRGARTGPGRKGSDFGHAQA